MAKKTKNSTSFLDNMDDLFASLEEQENLQDIALFAIEKPQNPPKTGAKERFNWLSDGEEPPSIELNVSADSPLAKDKQTNTTTPQKAPAKTAKKTSSKEIIPDPVVEPKAETSPPKNNKSFLGHLETFFRDTVEDSLLDNFRKKREGKKLTAKRRTKPAFGIDTLIKTTIETAQLQKDEHQKRIVLSFDQEKINKLTQIADLEQARIKDIINHLIVEYIDRYEDRKIKNKK
jgi:hypothetical protein